MEEPNSTLFLFLFVFFGFLGIVFLGLSGWIYYTINNAISIDIDIGNVNLEDINAFTFGKLVTVFLENLDNFGLVLLLGMCMAMILFGYVTGSSKYKIGFILDIVIILLSFVASIYISQTYEVLTDTPILGDFYVDYLPKSSTFLLNLPTIIATVGSLIMVATYSFTRRKEVSVLGY